jgi:hypothetical protein
VQTRQKFNRRKHIGPWAGASVLVVFMRAKPSKGVDAHQGGADLFAA